MSKRAWSNYQTQVNATEPENWTRIPAPTMQDAAINALRKRGISDNIWPYTVYVGELKLTHDNGTPMIVHAFTIERSTKCE